MNRFFIIIGIIFLLIGLLWPLIIRLGIGFLPGDIYIKKDNFSFYFPLTTSIILSIILTIILWLFRKK